MQKPPLSQSVSTAAPETAGPAPIIPFPEPERKPGRPTVCTTEVAEDICAAIRLDGISDSCAGLLAGVSPSTISRWKKNDEDFAISIGQARAIYDRDRLRAIRLTCKRDGTPDWRAQAWLAQASSPETFGEPGRRRSRAKRPEPEPEEEENRPPVVTPEDLVRLQAVRKRVLERGGLEGEVGAEDVAPPNVPILAKTPGEGREGASGMESVEGDLPPAEGLGATYIASGADARGAAGADPARPAPLAGPIMPQRIIGWGTPGYVYPAPGSQNLPNLAKTPAARVRQPTAEELAQAEESRRIVDSIRYAPDPHSTRYYEESIDHWSKDAIPGQWTGG